MSMRTTTTRAITAITIIVTRITAAVRASARKGLHHSTTRAVAASVSPRTRRRALRISSRSRPTRLIPPQYLPALARAQSLRRMSQLATTTARRR